LSDLEVHRELSDMNRRKKNVIVPGLMGDHNGNDAVAFHKLCEEYLHCEPMDCTRLGKPNEQHAPDKPRRLLV